MVPTPENNSRHYQVLYTKILTAKDLLNKSVTILMDPYRVAKIYGNMSAPRFQVLKKVLRWTSKGHTETEVLHEIIKCCHRNLDMLTEDTPIAGENMIHLNPGIDVKLSTVDTLLEESWKNKKEDKPNHALRVISEWEGECKAENVANALGMGLGEASALVNRLVLSHKVRRIRHPKGASTYTVIKQKASDNPDGVLGTPGNPHKGVVPWNQYRETVLAAEKRREELAGLSDPERKAYWHIKDSSGKCTLASFAMDMGMDKAPSIALINDLCKKGYVMGSSNDPGDRHYAVTTKAFVKMQAD